MYIEYTKQLTGKAFRDMAIAMKEREDNLLTENLSVEDKKALAGLNKTIQHLQDYISLYEMAGQLSKFWKPCQDLSVFFFGSSSQLNQKVMDYASEWSNYGSISFSVTQDINAAKIRVGYENSGHWSYIGTDAMGVPKNKQTVNFQLLGTMPERDIKQVVLHEFGHVLGLIHEHQSPAAGVSWNKSFIYAYCKLNYNWDRSQVNINILDEYEKTTTQYSSLDPLSIMGYYVPPLFTTNGIIFPKNYELSVMDKSFISQIYPMRLNS